MTYQNFKDAVIAYLFDALDDSAQISVQPILKNNQVVLDGLTITEHDCNISPTIYLNYYYDELQNGRPIEELQKQILSTYLSNKPTESIDISFYTSYQNISGRILFKLIHAKENEELLKEIPHLPYLDLAIVFYCLISTTPTGSATILIRSQHLTFWNISVDELYQQALTNTPTLLKAEIKSMNDIMSELLTPPELAELTKADSSPMYVLTNAQKLYGAVCILYPDILHQFALQCSKDLFILPSSVHEVLLLPADNSASIEELNQMVCDVNETQVQNEEILSNHIYLYSLSKQTILMPNP